MIEGSGSLPRTNGSGSGRPKHIRIRIRNTGRKVPDGKPLWWRFRENEVEACQGGVRAHLRDGWRGGIAWYPSQRHRQGDRRRLRCQWGPCSSQVPVQYHPMVRFTVQCCGFWFRIHLSVLDPDPYWVCGFWSGSRNMKIVQNLQINQVSCLSESLAGKVFLTFYLLF